MARLGPVHAGAAVLLSLAVCATMTSTRAVVTAQARDPLPRTTAAAAHVDKAALDRSTALLRQFIDDRKIAGAVAMLARDGRLVHEVALGYQDLETKTPMAADSIFRIYSMTKPVTAVAVMMLLEQGKFALDDAVSKYLPEFASVTVRNADGTTRPPARAITIRDLLLHDSGLNHRTSEIYQQERVRSRAIGLPEFVKNIVRVPLMEDPGTRFRYSESTTVLGRLVEIWSGQPLDAFFESKILAPLRMHDTGFYAKPEQRPRLVTAYTAQEVGGLKPFEMETVPFTEKPALLEGAVGLVSAAPDFLRFAQMLLNQGELDGVRLLRLETVASMVKNGLPDPVLATRRRGAVGWGLGNVEVVIRPEELRYPANVGEYGWDGTGGTIFWNDPVNRTTILLFVQASAPYDPDNLRQKFKTLIQAAVVN